MFLGGNPVFYARTKHVEVDVHFVREMVLSKELKIKYVSTEDQVADVFTKALSIPKFKALCEKLTSIASSLQ